MNFLITRNGWIRIAIVTLVGLALLPFSPGVRQQRNLRLAAAHADKLRPILQADPRFKSIQVGSHTGNGGSLFLRGTLDQAEDKGALAKLVADSKPPVPVTIVIFKPQLSEAQRETSPPPSTIHASGD